MNNCDSPVLENPPAVDVKCYPQSPELHVPEVNRAGHKRPAGKLATVISPAAMVLDIAAEAGTPFMEQC